MKVYEIIGFRFSPSAQIDTVTFDNKRNYDYKQSDLLDKIRVSEILRRVRASEVSAKDEAAIKAALEDRKGTDVLTIRDLDELAVIANVDVQKLRTLLNMK